MERCVAHPGAEAAAICSACGRPVCAECLEPGQDPPRCMDCAIQGASQDSASAAASRRPAPRPTARGGGSRLPAAIGVLVALVALAGAALLLQRRATAVGPEAVAAEVAAVGDLFLVEEVVAGLLEDGGALPDPERLAGELPPDLAAEVRVGTLRVESVEGGFAIRWRLPEGQELELVSRGGETEVVEGGWR